MEEPEHPLDELFDLQEKKTDDAMTKLSQVASCAQPVASSSQESSQKKRRRKAKKSKAASAVASE